MEHIVPSLGGRALAQHIPTFAARVARPAPIYCQHLPHSGILANSPNSVPPERVFSILNNTFDDDQRSAHADYIELSLQLQFNAHSRAPQ